jgi:hypothetical protein
MLYRQHGAKSVLQQNGEKKVLPFRMTIVNHI